MISEKEVKRIASLARLELTEKEVEKMQKDLSEILDYFDLLKRAPTKSLQGKHLGGRAENLRKDEVVSSHNLANRIIEGFPDKKDGYIKVKTIL